MVDIGDAGHHSDGVYFLIQSLEKHRRLELSPLSPHPIPGTTQPPLPFVFVGDEAFPLKTNLHCPYPGKNLMDSLAVFNYRLSRAQHIIENSFGVLAAR